MIAAAQVIYALSLLAMAALCAYVLHVRASRMRALWHALAVWFTVPSLAIGAQLAAPVLGSVLPPLLLLSALFMGGSSIFAWRYVVARVRGGQIALPDIEAILRAERRARTIMLADLVLARCEEWEDHAADAAS